MDSLRPADSVCTMSQDMAIREQRVSIDQAEFRRVLGHFASGVTVVTFGQEGQYHGLTVSAFCSLSLEPPLVLVCIDRRFASHELLKESGSFAVNILAEDGERLSRHFSSRAPDKFSSVPYHIGVTGAPLLDAALATIECRVVDQLPGGDHSIFVGAVLAADASDHAGPLLYFRSGYHRLK